MDKQSNSGGAVCSNSNHKVKLMCSYGGKIQPHPHGHKLVYVGGDTKIVSVDRNFKFYDIVAKLKSVYNFGNGMKEFCVKYQLPGEDLDALISVFDDDDVKHMMLEHDGINRASTKPARLRLFLFPVDRPLKFSDCGRSDELKANNVEPDSTMNQDFSFGFDKEEKDGGADDSRSKFETPLIPELIVPGNFAPGTSVVLHATHRESETPGSHLATQWRNGPAARERHVKTCECMAQQLVYLVPDGRYVIGLPLMPAVTAHHQIQQPLYHFVAAMPSVSVSGEPPIKFSVADQNNGIGFGGVEVLQGMPSNGSGGRGGGVTNPTDRMNHDLLPKATPENSFCPPTLH